MKLIYKKLLMHKPYGLFEILSNLEEIFSSFLCICKKFFEKCKKSWINENFIHFLWATIENISFMTNCVEISTWKQDHFQYDSFKYNFTEQYPKMSLIWMDSYWGDDYRVSKINRNIIWWRRPFTEDSYIIYTLCWCLCLTFQWQLSSLSVSLVWFCFSYFATYFLSLR